MNIARRLFSMLALIVLFASLAIAQADEPPAGAQKKSPPMSVNGETRVYNIGALLTHARNYPLDGSADAVAETVRENANRASNEDLVRSLVIAIMDTIRPEIWKDNGGDQASVRVFNNQSLVITAAPDVHEQVMRLLEQLQKDSRPSRMVRIEATWVLFGADDLKAIRAGAKDHVDKAMLTVGDDLLDRATAYSRGQTTGFDGQMVHITSGVQRSYVASLNPIVGNDAVGYQATMDRVVDGVSLQLKPQLALDGNSAIVDVMSLVNEVRGGGSGSGGAAGELREDVIVPSTQPSHPPGVQVPLLSRMTVQLPDRITSLTQRFHTTVRVPLDENVIVGGMTLEPTGGSGQPRNLYLVLRVNASPK